MWDYGYVPFTLAMHLRLGVLVIWHGGRLTKVFQAKKTICKITEPHVYGQINKAYGLWLAFGMQNDSIKDTKIYTGTSRCRTSIEDNSPQEIKKETEHYPALGW